MENFGMLLSNCLLNSEFVRALISVLTIIISTLIELYRTLLALCVLALSDDGCGQIRENLQQFVQHKLFASD